MADRTYNLTYTANNSDILAKSQAVIAELQQLDKLAAQLRSRLRSYAGGTGPGVQNAIRNAQALAVELTALEALGRRVRSVLRNYAAGSGGGNAAAISNAQNLAAALEALNAIAAQAKGNLKNYASGGNRSARTAATNAQNLTQTMNNLTSAAGNAKGALNGVGRGVRGVGATAREAQSSVMGFTTAMLAMQGLHTIVDAVRDGFEEIKKYAQECAEFVTKTREESREFANLMGRLGPDDAVLEQIGATALEAAVLPNEAREYLQQYKGVEQIGIEKHHITPEVSQALAVAGLKYTHRINVDDETAGKVVGRIAQFQQVPTVEHGMEALSQASWGIQQGKGEYKEGFKALDKIAPTIIGQAGGVKSIGEAGVLLGVYSQIAGSFDQAQHEIAQTRRLMNESGGAKGEYLKSLGITPEMSFVEKMEKLAPHVSGPNGEQILTDIGFHNARQREVAVAGIRELAIIKERFNRVGASQMAFNQVMAHGGAAANPQLARQSMGLSAMTDTQKYLDTDPHALNVRAKVTQDVQKMIDSHVPEKIERLRALADTRMRENYPEYRGPYNQLHEGIRSATSLGADGGIHMTQDLGGFGGGQYSVYGMLKAEGQKVGVDIDQQFPLAQSGGDEQVRAKALVQAAEAIEAKGGDPYHLKEVNQQQLDELRKMNQNMERLVQQREQAIEGRQRAQNPPRGQLPPMPQNPPAPGPRRAGS